MRIAAIFISICLLILAGTNSARAIMLPTYQHEINPSIDHSADSSDQYELSHVAAIPDEDPATLQLCDWVEDEDNLDLFAKKFKILPGTYASISNSTYLIQPVASTKGPAPISISARITYKYILQRVLRV